MHIETLCEKVLREAEPMSQNVVSPTNIGFGWIYYGLVRNLRPDFVVAIGSARGFMPICLARGLMENGFGKVLFVDPSYSGSGHPGWSGRGHWDDAQEVREWFEKFGVGPYIEHLKMESDVAFQVISKTIGEKACNLVVIDGAHTHQQSLKDFENYSQLICNGFVLFHDSINACCQVDRTLIELRHRGYNFVTISKDAGLSLLEISKDTSSANRWNYLSQKSDRHDWIYGLLKQAIPEPKTILEAYCKHTFLPEYFPDANIVGWDSDFTSIQKLRLKYPFCKWINCKEYRFVENLFEVTADVIIACGITGHYAPWDPRYSLEALRFLIATRLPKCCLIEAPACYHKDQTLQQLRDFLTALNYTTQLHEMTTSLPAPFNNRKLVIGLLNL